MISKPLVSVVIPTRNRKELLKKAVDSIINQSYQRLQIIVHDNNTLNLSENDINPRGDSRVEFYRSNEDLGMLENWRKGLHYVKGDLFLRFDDDNIMVRTYIEKAVNCFINSKTRMVTGNCLVTQNDCSVNSLVQISEAARRLSREQLLHFTFHNIIDSNYSVYDFKFLVDNFGVDGIYVTNLPDRYLDLRLSNIIDDQDILFFESISGVSRMDYRVTEFNTKLGELSFDEIMTLRDGSMAPQLSPHNNFMLSRFYVFLNYYKSGWVSENHIFNKIISYPILEIELLIGNFERNSMKISMLFLYYIKLAAFLIGNPKSYYLNKSGPEILPFVTKILIKSLVQSVCSDLFEKKKYQDLSFWCDRMESSSIDEFVNLYSSEAIALGEFKKEVQ